MAKMSITLTNPKILKFCVEAISELTDEAVLKFDEESLTLSVMDSSRIGLARLIMENHSFDDYHVYEEFKIPLNLEDLSKVMKRIGKDDTLKLTHDTDDLKARITLEQEGKTRNFSLAMIDLDYPDVPITNLLQIPYETQWTIDPDLILEAVRDAEIYDDVIQINADKNLTMRAWGTVGEMEYVLSPESLITYDMERSATCAYGISYLKFIGKLKSITEKLEMSLIDDHPIKMIFYLLEGGKMFYFAAPRVAESEEVDEGEQQEDSSEAEKKDDIDEMFDEEAETVEAKE